MTIEITEFANISITVSPTGVSSGNFGILGMLTNEEGVVSTAERVRKYTSLASVESDWTGTEVHKAAISFYAQTPTPTDFWVFMCFETAQPATLIGGGHDTLEELANINGTGVFNINVEGTDIALATVDFSGDADLDAVAANLEALLDAGLVGTTCTYETNGFVIEGPTVGSGNVISFATGNAAEALGFLQNQGKAEDGLDAESAVTAMAAANAKGYKPVGLVTHKKYRDQGGVDGVDGETTLELGVWCEGAKVIFCNTTNDLSTLNSVTESDTASVLKSATLRFSLTTFSKNVASYPSASVFGRAASTNFAAIGSTITLNLKQMPGVVAEDLTPNEFATLRSKNCSAVVNIANSANAYTDSRMASGSWLDTTHGLMWLENRTEVDMFNLLYTTGTKIPYTQSGINTTATVLRKSLDGAVRNGLCGPGYLGDGTYLSEGFDIQTVSLEDTPSADKSNRVYKGLSFRMVGAGALHEVEVFGQFVE